MSIMIKNLGNAKKHNGQIWSIIDTSLLAKLSSLLVSLVAMGRLKPVLQLPHQNLHALPRKLLKVLTNREKYLIYIINHVWVVIIQVCRALARYIVEIGV